MSGKRSAPDALSAAEKAAVLDELLAARPDLRELAEACAAQVMKDADRSAVADDVEDALQGLGIEEPNTRVGYRPGQGYVHPAVVDAVCCVYLCAAGAAGDGLGNRHQRFPDGVSRERPVCVIGFLPVVRELNRVAERGHQRVAFLHPPRARDQVVDDQADVRAEHRRVPQAIAPHAV